MKIKPGSLIRVRRGDRGETHWMYSQVPSQATSGAECATDWAWGWGDTGIVIEARQRWENNPAWVYYLIHTSRGHLGWILSDWAEAA